jgi:two-component system cell cycle sensor histidine kinase/response regulator CckA
MAQSSIPPKLDVDSRVSSLPPVAGINDSSIEKGLRARGDQLALLVEVNAALAAAIDAEVVLPQILSRLTARTQLLNASIYLLDPEKRQLRCAADNGFPAPEAYRSLELEGRGLTAWVARTGEGVYVPDVSRDPRYLCADPRAGSEYAVPLRAGATLLGVLNIESDQVDGIRAVARKLIDQLAGQVAFAIERSNLYKRLRDSEEHFRSIFEQSQFGVALGDLEGRFLNVNRAFGRILGYEPGELHGLHFSHIFHPDELPRAFDSLRGLLEGKTDYFYAEGQCLHKSGEPVWCSVIVSLIRDAAGHPSHALAMLYDISERKKAEEERSGLQEQLFHTQKMMAIGTLAGGIAHDFNNLLGVILGYASLVRRRLPPEDALQEPIRVMELSAQRAAELTRQLLQFARQETRQVEHLDIAEVVDHVLKVVSETFDRRIQIKACLAPELPCIEGDFGQLELAILNLCINARDAMPQGGTLTVETSLVTLGGADAPVPVHCAPGEYVRIAVRDTGVGIKPELLQRIFEPFFTTKEPGEGSGLGLATVYAIVNGYGGFVRAASQLGHGSEFTVYLPVLSRDVQPSVREQPQQVEHGTGTVLVVDDEPFMLTFAEEALQELGYEVLTAANGTRACEIYAQHAAEIDCVLLDMVMPGMSGFETQQALCAINPRVKVALVSGYSDGAEADRARESGAATFLGKPYTVETLGQVLKTVQTENGPDKDRAP